MTSPSKKKASPKLLSGGNPQIPKGEGDGPVQDYIAAMPELEARRGEAPRCPHRAHGPRRAQGREVEPTVLRRRGRPLVPGVPLLHEVRAAAVLPRDLARSGSAEGVQARRGALPRHPRGRRARREASSGPGSSRPASCQARRCEPLQDPALGRPVRADRDRPRRAAPGPRRVGRRPAPHRQAPPARRRVRLHRRRRRGRAHARRQRGRVRRRPRSGPGCCAASRRSTIGSTLLGRPLAYPLVLAPTGFTRIADPEGELAVARAAARAGLPVHAVDAQHPLDRGGPRRQRRPPVVPGLRLARPRAGQGDDRPGRRRPLRGARAHRRHRGARPARARRAPRVLAAAHDRARHDRRRRPPPRLDVVVRAQRTRSASPTSSAATSATAPRRSPSSDYINTQFDPALVVGRRRLAALGVGRPDRAQGHPDRRGRRARRRRAASTPSRCPTTAAASSTARPPRSRSSRPSPTPSAAAPRSSATAASAAAATSSRPSPPARPPPWPAAPTSTASAPPASAASTASSTGSAPTSSAP